MLQKIWKTLEGKKTYILAGLGIILWLGWVFDCWTFDQIDQLFALLGLLGVFTTKHAINRKK